MRSSIVRSEQDNGFMNTERFSRSHKTFRGRTRRKMSRRSIDGATAVVRASRLYVRQRTDSLDLKGGPCPESMYLPPI